MLNLLHELSEKLDYKKCINMLTAKFAKAFDTRPISHCKLIHKLIHYNINIGVAQWINTFMKSSSFCFTLGVCQSDYLRVKNCVLQGSKLEPLTYILFANNLCNAFKFARITKSTDDLSIYAVINNKIYAKKFQNDLDNLCEWAKK